MVAIKLNELIPKIIKHCDFEKYLTKNGYVKTQRNLPDGAIAFYEKSGARVLDDWRVAQMDDVAVTKFVNQYFSEK